MTRAKWYRRPDGLSEEAQKDWRRLGPVALANETLKPETAASFAHLCMLLATARAAGDEIARHGVTVLTSAGSRKSNPAVNAMIAAQRAAAPLLREFGLSSGWSF